MTVTVVLDLTPELEARLRKGLARRDAKQVRQLLAAALATTVDTWIPHPAESPPPNSTESLAEQFVESIAGHLDPAAPLLAADAINRTGLYLDHA